jgi:hypothetical protein
LYSALYTLYCAVQLCGGGIAHLGFVELKCSLAAFLVLFWQIRQISEVGLNSEKQSNCETFILPASHLTSLVQRRLNTKEMAARRILLELLINDQIYHHQKCI